MNALHPYTRRGRKCNLERAQQIRDLAAQGYSQTVIGDMLGITRERVRQICKRDSIETLTGKLDWDARDRIVSEAQNGGCVAEIARRTGHSSVLVQTALREAGLTADLWKKPTPTADRIRELAGQGLNRTQIARSLGIPQSSVSRAVKQWGILCADGRRRAVAA